MKVFVIGGGPAGLVSAISAARNGADVTILERNSKCGKKLLITGNGRANYWNDTQEVTKYHSNDMALCTSFWENNKDLVLPFFSSLGLIPKIKNGYYYPFSNQAVTLLNILMNEINRLKVEVIYNALVCDIKKDDDFLIQTTGICYHADKVIITTGSKAAPHTGSDGLGYQLATKLNHHLTPIAPALVQLKGQESYFKEWAGIRTDALVSLYDNNELIKTEAGELLLTDYGLSGICIFNLSREAINGLNKSHQINIKINFVPWFQEKDFRAWLNQHNEKLPNYAISEILDGFLNYKLVNLILKRAQIKPTAKWQDIDQARLVTMLQSFNVPITGYNSYDQAQVCQGGISLSEIDITTLESKIVKGLYFAGEILDVDGDCGGYNLGFAWMSGLVAGKSVSK